MLYGAATFDLALGLGIAYGTTHPEHLVNGLARLFSLYDDAPGDPVSSRAWLNAGDGTFVDGTTEVLGEHALITRVIKVADVNADGWLDLVVSSYYDSITHHRDTGMSIFWGGPKGWSPRSWDETRSCDS